MPWQISTCVCLSPKLVCVCVSVHCNLAFVHCKGRRGCCLLRLHSFHFSRDCFQDVLGQAGLAGFKLRRNLVCGDVQNFFHPNWCDLCIRANLHSRSPRSLLLLLLAGLYWPDTTWSFQKFDAFAVLPFVVFFMYSSPSSFFVSCSFSPLSPFQAGPLLYSPNPISFLGLSFLSAPPLCLILVFIEYSYRSARIWVK